MIAADAAAMDGSRSEPPHPVGSCITDEECVPPDASASPTWFCAYGTDSGCASYGTCRSIEAGGGTCTSDRVCNCAGYDVSLACDISSGESIEPIAHAGPCTDGTVPCNSVSDCAPIGQLCGYRSSEGCAATTKYCYDDLYAATDRSAVLLRACGCDGGVVGYGEPTGDDGVHVSSPVRSLKACEALDAGETD